MTSESRVIKGGNSTIGKRLATLFYDTSGMKCTTAEFMRGVGNIKALLQAGYTEKQIEDCILWICKNKPEVYNLAWLVKCINDVIFKIRVEEIKKEEKTLKPNFTEAVVYEDVENTNKNKINSNRKVRGT